MSVVSRPAGADGLVRRPKRWVVERSIAWFGRYRRLSEDDERTAASAEAWIRVSAVSQMLRRLKPNPAQSPPPVRYPEPQRRAA